MEDIYNIHKYVDPYRDIWKKYNISLTYNAFKFWVEKDGKLKAMAKCDICGYEWKANLKAKPHQCYNCQNKVDIDNSPYTTNNLELIKNHKLYNVFMSKTEKMLGESIIKNTNFNLTLNNNNNENSCILQYKLNEYSSIDFYLPKYNIGIECQGEQHFTNVDSGGDRFSDDFTLTKKFIEQLIRDIYKYLFFNKNVYYVIGHDVTESKSKTFINDFLKNTKSKIQSFINEYGDEFKKIIIEYKKRGYLPNDLFLRKTEYLNYIINHLTEMYNNNNTFKYENTLVYNIMYKIKKGII